MGEGSQQLFCAPNDISYIQALKKFNVAKETLVKAKNHKVVPMLTLTHRPETREIVRLFQILRDKVMECRNENFDPLGLHIVD